MIKLDYISILECRKSNKITKITSCRTEHINITDPIKKSWIQKFRHQGHWSGNL